MVDNNTSKQPTAKPTLAIAVFVKTPEVSPVKTRLAKGIGKSAALEFYELACAATQEILKTVSEMLAHEVTVQPYWAVAEPDQTHRWQGLPTMTQGHGCLGTRLEKVYNELLVEHDHVALIGADSPHLHAEQFANHIRRTVQQAGFVLGPATDGGFYYFAGCKQLPDRAWLNVTYSTDTTAQELLSQIAVSHEVVELEALCDVDHHEDLYEVQRELGELSAITTAQQQLLDWLRLFKSSPQVQSDQHHELSY